MDALIPLNSIRPGLGDFLSPHSRQRVTKLKNPNTDYTQDTDIVVQYAKRKLKSGIFHNKNILSCQSSNVNRQSTESTKQKSEENRQKSQCRFCISTNLIQQEAPPPHYKKLVCGDCGGFIKWMPNPEKQERLDKYRNLIIFLSEKPLVGWDGFFIRDLFRRVDSIKNFSPKQINNLARISEVWGVR